MSNLSNGRTLEERFWAQVNKTDSCWLWTGHIATGKGYGRIRVNGEYQKAHRVSYELFVGPIPDGLQLDHLCRVRNCVNPEHLEPVTNRENGLRGTSPIYENLKKTHCSKGHPLSGDNLYPRTDGGRRCRICKVEADRIGAEKRSYALTASGKRKLTRKNTYKEAA
jgi:HNH endonuclease